MSDLLLNVDVAVLDAIADRLIRVGDSVDTAGSSAPSPPDAGPGTPVVSDVLARLCAGAASLAESLRGTGSRVAEASRVYAQEDADAGQSLHEAY
ncbi:hypothetical protein [Actinoplanes sp. L3-i22]|uniref:hypothetical protein n=1 Tax=Actinoplanes sp. L3-i22 TaxID=2836373 RepID=UPI001C79A5E7|nr:hypothetical protein [Actinoplanes sp. L3-i22]BCY06332.1 hypothetical protein L3i22_014200 [Actinoplanes sp. L3-i22]